MSQARFCWAVVGSFIRHEDESRENSKGVSLMIILSLCPKLSIEALDIFGEAFRAFVTKVERLD
jgi:hypothetical protein